MAGELQRLGHAVELVEIATRGDLEQVVAVEEIGTRGVFTKEIQRALLAGDVDLAVHSLKDLPTEPVEGLMLAAVPARESSADVLVSRECGDIGRVCRRLRVVGTGACGGRRSCGMCGRICRWRMCAGMSIRGCGSWTRVSSMRLCWPRRGCGDWGWRIEFRRCCHWM